MNKQFNVTIINSDKTIYEGKVLSLVAPCELGYLGVLAGHMPLVANLIRGKITLQEDQGREPLIFASEGKGFLEVLNNNVTLLLT